MVYENECYVCHSTFLGKRKKVLCEVCRRTFKEKKCIVCGKKYAVKRCYKSFNEKCRNCSVRETFFNKKEREKECKDCGNKFMTKTSTIRCNSCKSILHSKSHVSNNKERQCLNCKGTFIGNGTRKYCDKCRELKLVKIIKNDKPKIVLKHIKNMGLYDSGICVYCSEGKPSTFHHIIPREFGGPSTLENCIPLCLKCHNEVEILTYDLLSRKPGFSMDDLRGFIQQHNFPNEDSLLEDNTSFKPKSLVQEL